MITYAILLRKLLPEKVHGKTGQAFPPPQPRKELPSVLCMKKGCGMALFGYHRNFVGVMFPDARWETGMECLVFYMYLLLQTLHSKKRLDIDVGKLISVT